MAEIRSTLEMVMERAARMAAEHEGKASDDLLVKEGMKLAAEYMNTGNADLAGAITSRSEAERAPFVKGILDTLLRNITLPRDESIAENAEKALDAVNTLTDGASGDICSELHQLLGQYGQHKEQVTNQLDDAIRNQLVQQYAQQGREIADPSTINPAMHPQYAEEMKRMMSDLNSQYIQAFDQRKEMIRTRILQG